MSNSSLDTKFSSYYSIIPSNEVPKYLPTFYSEKLINFIKKLLLPMVDRPSAINAYSEAIIFYIGKYFRISSIICTLHYFSNIPLFLNYFMGDKINNYIENDINNDIKKYVITKTFKEALNKINPSKFSFGLINMSCLKLRLILYTNKERMNSKSEIEIEKLIPDLLFKIHKELIYYIDDKIKFGKNSMNNKEETGLAIQNINELNEKAVISSTVREFTKKKNISEISNNFFYLIKNSQVCPKCNNILKYSCSINCLYKLYPEQTVNECKKDNINIYDILNFCKEKGIINNDNIECKYCRRKGFKKQMFYNTPPNIIFEFCYINEKFNFKIDEDIDIKDFVERKDISKTEYALVGGIFSQGNENENKYIITIKQNGDWFLVDGYDSQKYKFCDLLKLRKLKILFYCCK